MTPIPSYLSPEAWSEFVKMRQKIKKPLTDYAAKLILRRLQAIKTAGHDPNAALDQSTVNCWAGVWPARDEAIQAAGDQMVRASEKWLDEQREQASQSTAPPQQIRELAARLRRVS